MPTVKNVLDFLTREAPLSLAEDYDNVGLLIGNAELEVTGVLSTLEVTPEGIQAALEKECNLIVSHHPLIFRGLKRIDLQSSQGNMINDLLRHHIALIALHTNWDRFHGGTSFYMGRLLGLENLQVLAPEPGRLSRLAFTVPSNKAQQLRSRFTELLRSVSTRYDSTAQWWEVTESFRPINNAQPRDGSLEQLSEKSLIKLVYILHDDQIASAFTILRKEHPYEEFWYEIQSLDNTAQTVGFGSIGNFREPMTWQDCLLKVKETFGCDVIRHSRPPQRLIQRVAFCGGSGASLYPEACRAGADVFITADVKYHDLAEASPGTMIADIGHYESEYRVAEQFRDLLRTFLPVSVPVHVFHPKNPVFYS